jgi:hypothetical protein
LFLLGFLIGLFFNLPVSRIPSPAIALFFKTAQHPDLAWGCLPPETADPDKIVAVWIEVPVPVDPENVISFGFFIGRLFGDGGRWFLGEDWAARAACFHGLGEGFVDGAALSRLGILIERGNDGESSDPCHVNNLQRDPSTGERTKSSHLQMILNHEGLLCKKIVQVKRNGGAHSMRSSIEMTWFQAANQIFAAFFRAAARSVFSHVKFSSSRPK